MMSLGVFRQEQLKCCRREGDRMVASFFGEGVLLADAMSSPRVFGPMLGRWAGERCLYRVWAVQLSFCVDYSRRQEFVWVCKWASVSKSVICDSMIEQNMNTTETGCFWGCSHLISTSFLHNPIRSGQLCAHQFIPDVNMLLEWSLVIILHIMYNICQINDKAQVVQNVLVTQFLKLHNSQNVAIFKGVWGFFSTGVKKSSLYWLLFFIVNFHKVCYVSSHSTTITITQLSEGVWWFLW